MYLIDGHNLIGKLPGIMLSEIDDEQHLITLLQVYARVRRRAVEVYFDGAPPGQARTRSYGMIKAHFVIQGTTADEAIRMRLDRMGRAARNAIVVTSDRQVMAEARKHQAGVVTSEAFGRELLAAQQAPAPTGPAAGEEPPLSPDEVDEWLRMFQTGRPEKPPAQPPKSKPKGGRKPFKPGKF